MGCHATILDMEVDFKMRRGVSKEKFLLNIRIALSEIEDAAQSEAIVEELITKGYTRGQASRILEMESMLETLSVVELGVLADSIFQVTGMSRARIDYYLEEAEIEVVRGYKITQAEEEGKNLLVFEDVRQVAHDIWTVVVPCQKIAELYRGNAVKYDYKTQREPSFLEDSLIPTPTVNWNAVEEIREELVANTFIPNTVTFNLPKKFSGELMFDKLKKRVIITSKELTILDGFHRSLGIVSALRDNPNLNYNFEMRITNFDTDKARQFIVQEDKRNPISKAYIKSIDTTDEATVVVNSLNEHTRSSLRGRITLDHNTVKRGDSLVTFDLMYTVIDRLWEINSFTDGDRLSEYLRLFFNEVASLRPQEFQGIKKASSPDTESIFAVYLMLAKELEYNAKWMDILPKALNKLDYFDVEERVLAITTSDMKRRFSKHIEEFKPIIREATEND